MKKYWKKYKIGIAISIYALLGGIFIWKLAIPNIRNIKDKADMIQAKIVDSEHSRERISQIPEMEENARAFQEKSGDIAVILDPNDKVEFIKKLEEMAGATGNSIALTIEDEGLPKPDSKKGSNAGDSEAGAAAPKTAAVTKKKKEEDKTIEERLGYTKYIKMKIKVSGDYEGLVNFIHKIENADYYVNILSIESKVSKDSTKPNIIDVDSLPASNTAVGTPAASVRPKPKADTQYGNLDSILEVVIYITG